MMIQGQIKEDGSSLPADRFQGKVSGSRYQDW